MTDEQLLGLELCVEAGFRARADEVHALIAEVRRLRAEVARLSGAVTADAPQPAALTIEEAANQLQAEYERAYPGCFAGIGAGVLHLYIYQRTPRSLACETFLGYPVKWHFGVDPKPAGVSRG